MTHLWLRAEQRDNEARTGLTPDGVTELRKAGMRVTVEDSPHRCLATDAYRAAGADIVAEGSWPEAPPDALILGLKELPDDDAPLSHTHIMFGHAFKGQAAGQRLLRRFQAGGGRLLDLEYLVDADGRRLAAFGYWAGHAGAAVSLKAWAAQQRGDICGPVSQAQSATHLLADLQSELVAAGATRPSAIVIGALGRVGTGAGDLLTAMGVATTRWDLEETAHGGPFPEILAHDLFLNCIFARPGTPVFLPAGAPQAARRLTVVGDIACDPTSDFSPIKVYDRATTWEAPVIRVHDTPPLDVMAIDNLPAMLPAESSEDFAGQLLPSLARLDRRDEGEWARARATFDRAIAAL